MPDAIGMAGDAAWKEADPMVDDKDRKIWSVYFIANETHREVYFGVAKDPEERILGGHCCGTTKAIEHWDLKKDKWTPKIQKTGMTQSDASELAHTYERSKPVDGWTYIQTAGI